jgi:excisionase family DNA binding protein
MEHNDLLLAGDAARLLGISYSRLQQLIVRGRLRAVGRTPGGVRLFDLADVNRLREERTRQGRDVPLAVRTRKVPAPVGEKRSSSPCFTPTPEPGGLSDSSTAPGEHRVD